MYLKWALMVPVSLIVTIIGMLIAPLLPFFAKDGWLPNWLWWWQTPDNSLYGDEGWKHEHWLWRYKLPDFLSAYIGQVGWLWRNPGYGFGCVNLEDFEHFLEANYSGNAQVNDDPLVEGYCLVHARNLFQLVWCKKITSTKCLYFVFGWNIKGLIGSEQKTHIATYAFSPRVSTFRV